MVVLQQQKKKTPMMMMGNWAGLPHNIIDEIMDRLVDLSDYIRFGSVCVSWRSTTLDNRNHRGKKNQVRAKYLDDDYRLPMLMVPHCSWEDDRAQFYSVTQEKILNDFQPNVPYYANRFIGSSFGWLVAVDTNFALTLFNPFSTATIQLPHVITSNITSLDDRHYDISYFNHEYYFLKAILSANPASDPDEYLVMLIYGKMKKFAFIRPGPGGAPSPPCWRYLELFVHGFYDVIYSKSTRLFYPLRQTGEVCSIDIGEEKAHCFTPTLEIGRRCDLRYIVQTRNGDLLQVYRFLLDSFGGTTYHIGKIKVFKLKKTTSSSSTSTTPVCYWTELTSLGDNALFVGDCISMCVAASDFPGCHTGSIYYSLPFLPYILVTPKSLLNCTYKDMGVANIQSEKVEPLHIIFRHYDVSDEILNRPPIWVLPTFREHGQRRS
ncbi:hypothetical protein LguiA_012190 [Lonicera macranthoides]